MIANQIAITRRAESDVRRIFDAVSGVSPQGAADIVVGINDAIDRLRDTPHRAVVARQPAGESDAVRSVAVGVYVAYFRAIVRVLRVRHGARRPLRRYG